MEGEYIMGQVGGAAITQLHRPVPTSAAVAVVTRRQALRALLDADLLGAIGAAIEALPEPDRSRARIDWDSAGEFRRDFPLLISLADAIGLTSLQIDDLFAAASAID